MNRAAARPWINGRAVVMTLYLVFLMLPIYWLVNMSLKTNTEITTALTLGRARSDLRELRQDLHRSELVLAATSTRSPTCS